MAEGRSATLLFHLQKRGFNVTGSTPDTEDDGFITVKLRIPLPWLVAARAKGWLLKTLYLFRHGLWPASISTLITVVSGITLLTVFAEEDSWLRSGWLARLLWRIDSYINPFARRLSETIRFGYLSAGASLAAVYFVVWAERLLLRLLLSFGPVLFLYYRLKAHRENNSLALFLINLWAFCIRRLSGMHNTTYAYQLSLPLLPIPPLQQTVSGLIKSVEPILENKELEHLEGLANAFLNGEGRRLQRYLKLRSVLLRNYVTPWFERYVYLGARASLAINSNYYVMDTMKPSPVKDQVFRAANLVYHLLSFQELLRGEQLEPRMLQDTLPLCMAQYKRLFNTTRIPGRETDALKHNQDADYIVVTRRGRFYRVFTKRDDGLRLSPAEWAHQLRLITEHANLDAASRGPNCDEKDLMALTSLPRTQWAEIRDCHFGDGSNRKSLLIIEKAAFVVNLVSESRLSSPGGNGGSSPSGISPKKFFPANETEVQLNRRAHFLFHGEGSDIWFDKSFNLIIFEDGQAGLNAEITFGDAPIMAHMWEYALLNELIDFESCRDASALAGESLRGAPLPMPLRLEFSVNDQLANEIKRAKREAREAAKDVDLDILCFDTFGREFIKALGTSPDSFIQMALLLTTYVDGPPDRFGLSYESGHTRLFRDGRTETIRSVTKQSLAFVKYCSSALADPAVYIQNSMFLQDSRKLLLEACAKHQRISIKSVAGSGIDRHLFALNVASKGLDIKSEFLDYASTRLPWSLSSSQHPQVQTKLRELLPESLAREFCCPGGGYAPISDDGYGVAYTMTANQLFFHVTCKKSSVQTNVRRFTTNLRKALELMRTILRPSADALHSPLLEKHH